MSGPRTFWHLAALGRKPRDYDIASTQLLYYSVPPRGSAGAPRGFAVATGMADWYRVHQRERVLRCDDWDAFRDPRETTYTRYTELQRDKEVFVDALLTTSDDEQVRALSPRYVALLDRVLGPLRYPVHGLQMITSYVGSMAPGGRIAIACLLQAADELRRVQRLAQRTRQLQRVHPELASGALTVWQRDPVWQPLRALIERLLVTYDWDEALVALVAGVKPVFDEVFGARLGALAAAHGDELLQRMLGSLAEDGAWHRAWSSALLEHLAADAANRTAIDGWRSAWADRAHTAVRPISDLYDAEAKGGSR